LRLSQRRSSKAAHKIVEYRRQAFVQPLFWFTFKQLLAALFAVNRYPHNLRRTNRQFLGCLQALLFLSQACWEGLSQRRFGCLKIMLIFLRGQKRVWEKGPEKRLLGKTTPIKLIHFPNNLEKWVFPKK